MTDEIYALLASLPRLDHTAGKSDVPSDGIYIFYENGETATVGGWIVDRIVRIGTHRAAGRLPVRIRSHFSGNRRGSVFRRHVGGALMARRDSADPTISEWVKQRGMLMPEMEVEVSATLRDRFTYSCIRVADRNERLSLERGLIALLAQRPIGTPSESWLGRHAVNSVIQASGLWNTQDVDAQPLTASEFTRLHTLVEQSLRSTI